MWVQSIATAHSDKGAGVCQPWPRNVHGSARRSCRAAETQLPNGSHRARLPVADATGPPLQTNTHRVGARRATRLSRRSLANGPTFVPRICPCGPGVHPLSGGAVASAGLPGRPFGAFCVSVLHLCAIRHGRDSTTGCPEVSAAGLEGRPTVARQPSPLNGCTRWRGLAGWWHFWLFSPAERRDSARIRRRDRR